jgi:hypothetical protein
VTKSSNAFDTWAKEQRSARLYGKLIWRFRAAARAGARLRESCKINSSFPVQINSLKWIALSAARTLRAINSPCARCITCESEVESLRGGER